MNGKEKEFILPLGLTDEKGALHRRGTMRPVTAEDELMLMEIDGVRFNDRQRDLELLARTVTSLGTLPRVTPEILEELYEADFIYLQMLFNSLNEDGNIQYECPRCGRAQTLNLSTLFAGESEDSKREIRFALPDGRGLKPEMGTKVKGTMKMAKCRDYITLHRDARTRENPSWFYVAILTRSLTRLGAEKAINNSVITKLSPTDFTFLVDMYNQLNNGVMRRINVSCGCGGENQVELHLPGEA